MIGLCGKNLPKKIQNEIVNKGISVITHGSSKSKQKRNEYPITHQLIKDGRKNKVLSKKIKSKIIVTMIHGQKDEAVPVSFSKKVISLFPFAKKKLVIIKNGDHSLSNKQPLKRIIKELDIVVKNVI